MKAILVLCSAFAVAHAGVGVLNQRDEQSALQLYNQVCAQGSGDRADLGGYTVYCKQARDDFQEVLTHQVIVPPSNGGKDQVIFVLPPAVKYRHNIQLSGSPGQGQQAKIYVLPQRATHQISASYNGGQTQNVKPAVYFLNNKGAQSGISGNQQQYNQVPGQGKVPYGTQPTQVAASGQGQIRYGAPAQVPNQGQVPYGAPAPGQIQYGNQVQSQGQLPYVTPVPAPDQRQIQQFGVQVPVQEQIPFGPTVQVPVQEIQYGPTVEVPIQEIQFGPTGEALVQQQQIPYGVPVQFPAQQQQIQFATPPVQFPAQQQIQQQGNPVQFPAQQQLPSAAGTPIQGQNPIKVHHSIPVQNSAKEQSLHSPPAAEGYQFSSPAQFPGTQQQIAYGQGYHNQVPIEEQTQYGSRAGPAKKFRHSTRVRGSRRNRTQYQIPQGYQYSSSTIMNFLDRYA